MINFLRRDILKNILLLFLIVPGTSCKSNGGDEEGPSDEKKSLKTETVASKANESINIMTFNILWDKETSGPTQWSYRRQSMVNLMKRHHPDMIGIQEGFINQMDYIKSEIKYEYFGWGTDDGKSHLENPGRIQSLNPIMYDPGRLTVSDKGVFWYADQTGIPGKYTSDTHFRNCVWGKFKENGTNGKTFYVFNTHFSLTDDIRQKQAVLLKAKIREIAGVAAEVIVIGDFNSDPLRDLSYNVLINPNQEMTLVDSKSICSGPPLGPSFTGSGLKVNSRTSGYEVDHVFVRNINICTDYKIITDYEGDYYPSDHFPVLSVLNWNK